MREKGNGNGERGKGRTRKGGNRGTSATSNFIGPA